MGGEGKKSLLPGSVPATVRNEKQPMQGQAQAEGPDLPRAKSSPAVGAGVRTVTELLSAA